MSTEMQEDMHMATLEELFEFIDCCVCPDIFPDSINATDPCCEHAMLPPLELADFTNPEAQGSPTTIDRSTAPSESETQTKPKRRRKRTGWSSSTELQRRKRAELQFLREHVRDLEAYAETLKKRVGLVKDERRVEELSCNWQEMAVAEYVERQKAEETNRALRRIIDNQLQVSAALRVIAEQNALVCLKYH